MKRRKQNISYPRNVRKSPIVRFVRRRFGLEMLCDQCSRLFVERPESVPAERYVHGSAVVCLYVENRFGR